MIVYLRFLGIANAALWFGATLFFTFGIGPAFFSQETLQLFGWPQTGNVARFYAGATAQIVLARYFILNYICGGIALLHLMAEWLYSGRSPRRLRLYLVMGLCLCSLAGGLYLQPRLRQWHRVIYGAGGGNVQPQVEQARKNFKTLHGISQMLNLVVVAGALIYLHNVCPAEAAPRFVGRATFTKT